jgi:peptide/nickel transport system permease protein
MLPSVGRGPPLAEALAAAVRLDFTRLLEWARYLVLPSLTLGIYGAAVISRVVRSTMLEALGAPNVRAATARGLRRRQVVLRHALRNALVPVISVAGLRFGELLGGAVLTESIFGWPGLGQLAVTAISQRDMPLVQGIVLVFAFMFAVVNMVADLMNAAIDPRITTD